MAVVHKREMGDSFVLCEQHSSTPVKLPTGHVKAQVPAGSIVGIDGIDIWDSLCDPVASPHPRNETLIADHILRQVLEQ